MLRELENQHSEHTASVDSKKINHSVGTRTAVGGSQIPWI